MDKERTPIYEFEGFRLDVSRKCLCYDDEIVALTPKSLETLIVLIRNRRQVVEKNQIFDEVWPDVFVEETTLAQNIRTIRKTLAKFRAETEFVSTVPRRGYRFVAEVREDFSDEEILIFEKRTRTRVIADDRRVHESAEKRSFRNLPYLRLVVIGLVVIGCVAVGFFGFRRLTSSKDQFETRFSQFRTDQLAASASNGSVALSPDGKYLVSAMKSEGGQSLVLYQTDNGNPLKLVDRLNGRFLGAAFSPDGDRIYFSVVEDSGTAPGHGSLYDIPFLGGAPKLIATGVDSAPAISPRGESVAFVRRIEESGQTALVTAGIDGSAPRNLAVRPLNEGFTPNGAAWSPDGNLISATVVFSDEKGRRFGLAVVDVNSGEQRVVGNSAWSWAGQTAWLRDGSGIAVIAFGASSPHASDEIWIVSFPDGRARLVSNGVNGVFGVSLAADSSILATVKTDRISNFVIAPIGMSASSQRILTKIGDDGLLPPGADWTIDGGVIYSQTTNGNADIWKIDSETGTLTQLSSDASRELLPRVASDGSFMIFLSNRSGRTNVWRSGIDGMSPRQLTNDEDVIDAVLSPRGDSVYYLAASPEGPFPVLWRINSEGGERRRLTDRRTYSPRISPDGRMIAAFYPNPEKKRLMLALLSTADGTVLRYLDSPKTDSVPLLEWAPDGKAVYLVLSQNGKFGFWRQPLEGAGTRIYEWETDSVFRFSISKDGRRVFFDHGIETNSIILLRSLGESN